MYTTNATNVKGRFQEKLVSTSRLLGNNTGVTSLDSRFPSAYAVFMHVCLFVAQSHCGWARSCV